MSETILIEFVVDNSQILTTAEILRKMEVLTDNDLETIKKLGVESAKAFSAASDAGKKMLPTLGQIQTNVESISDTFINEFQKQIPSSLIKSGSSLQQFIKQLKSVGDATPLDKLQKDLAGTLTNLSDLAIALSQIKQKSALEIQLKVATDPTAIASLQKQLSGLTKFGTDPASVAALRQEFSTTLQGAQQVAAQIDKLKASEDNATKSEGTFRSQIRATTEALAQRLAAGKLSVAELYEEAKAAGVMRDAMGDATRTISALASDTFVFDAITDGVQTAAASMQVFAGISALVGNENQDLQKVLVRLNAVMAITTGLQQITNALQKQSSLVLGAQLVIEKTLNFIRTGSFQTTKQIVVATEADVIAKEADTVATVELTAATEASSIAMQVFRVALLATGIGAVVVLVGALVSAFSEFSSKASDAAESEKNLNDTIEKTTESIQAQIDFINKSGNTSAEKIQTELDLAEKRGASENELFAIRQRLYNQELTTAKQAQDAAIKRAEKEDVNVSNSISGYAALTNAAETYFNDLDALENQRQNALNDLKAAQQKNDKDDIKDAQNKLAATESALSSAQAKYQLYGGVIKQVSDSEINLQQLTAEKTKAATDQKKEDLQALIDIQQIAANKFKSLADAPNLGVDAQLQSLKSFVDQQTAVLNLQRQKDLKDENLTALERLAINIKYYDAIDKLNSDAYKQRNTLIAGYNKQLKEQDAADFQSILNDEQKAIQTTFDNIDKAFADIGKNNTNDKSDRLKKLQDDYTAGVLTATQLAQKLNDLDTEFDKTSLDNQQAYLEAKLSNLKKNLEQNKISQEDYNTQSAKLQSDLNDVSEQLVHKNVADTKDAEDQKLEILKTSLEEQKQLFQNALQFIQTGIQALGDNFSSAISGAVLNVFAVMNSASTDLKARLIEIDKDDTLNKVGNEALKSAEIVKAQTKAIHEEIGAAFVATQTIINAAFQASFEARKQQVDAEIARLEDRKNAELSNTELTEGQKAAIQKKYAAQEAALKNKAARQQRQADIAQAIVNGLLAAGNALATVKPFIPNALIAAGLAVTLAAIQVANIRSAPLPQFKKGTRHAPAGYALVGEEGPEIVQLKGGERIYTNRETRIIEKRWEKERLKESYLHPVLFETGKPKLQHDNILKVIHSPIEKIAAIIPQPVDKEIIEKSYKIKTENTEIDYDLLGSYVAKHMAKVIQDLPQYGSTWDENGVREWIKKGNQTDIILNKKSKIKK